MVIKSMAWLAVSPVLLVVLLTSCVDETNTSQYKAPPAGYGTSQYTSSSDESANIQYETRPQDMIDQQDITAQIEKEKSSYTKSYLVDAVDVVGKCDAVLNSPKYMVSSAASEARTAYTKLRINHAEFEDSALDGFLSQTVEKITKLAENLNYIDARKSSGYRPSQREYDIMIYKLGEIPTLIPQIKTLIEGINSAI